MTTWPTTSEITWTQSKMQKDYLPEVPNADAYPVDFKIEGKSGIPLFLYGVPNRDKARLTTIMLGHFHRHNLDFESIIVFENRRDSKDRPRPALRRRRNKAEPPTSTRHLNRRNLGRKLGSGMWPDGNRQLAHDPRCTTLIDALYNSL